ncbi:hypothetical protein OUZ56_011691 [Daphnia magna]|uniref:Uncharacterized protein n=1 Tax=Daphnia magna TaxID=35525 RepID=A0ABQ9Z119_9CRUS|nr:hypothetical protein OUZ56_011691 [Daphnia magna]
MIEIIDLNPKFGSRLRSKWSCSIERESDEAGKNGTSSCGKNSSPKNKESIPYVVYVPPKYYQKESVYLNL